ncbi:MAG: hypothetical protein WA821_00430 [Anaerolineales bacterium]
MLEILRDPIWQTVLGIVAIIIAISALRLQQNIKEISCKILSIAPLFDIKDDLQGKLKVLFDNKPVENAFLIVFKIANSGKIPVTADDQKRAITIDFGAEKILTAEIIEEQPFDIDASLATENCSVILKPTLLNPGDAVTIKTVAESFNGKISTSARIVGAKQIETIMPDSDMRIGWLKNYKRAIFGAIAGIIGFSSLILAITTFAAHPVITVSQSDPITETAERATKQVNNCGGTSEVKTRIQEEANSNVSAFINNQKIVDPNGYIELAGAGTFIPPIGQKIAGMYGLTYGQDLNKTAQLDLITPAANNVIYEIQFIHRYGTGKVTIYQPSKNTIAQYEYKILIGSTVNLISREQLICP